MDFADKIRSEHRTTSRSCGAQTALSGSCGTQFASSCSSGTRIALSRRFALYILLALLALFFVMPVRAASGRILISGSPYVAKGKSVFLTASEPVKWKSNKPSVAKVTKRGKVKGRRAGTAIITAISLENKRVKARFRIRVTKKPAKRIQLSTTSLTLDVTKKPAMQLTAAATPAKAAQAFSWTSDAPSIVTVDANGLARARKAGSAVITCSAIDGSKKSVSIPVTVTDQAEEERIKRELEASYCNILLVGNSYTQDEFGYVPALLKEFFPSLRFRIGLLYTGGASLQLHYNNLMNTGNTYHSYSEYTSESTRWEQESRVRLSDVITKYPWKIVTFQQCSNLQDSFDSMQPYIKALMDGYTKAIGRQPVYLYVFPHVRGARNPKVAQGAGTTAGQFGKYVPIVQNVMKAFPFKTFIPNATAIENARKTSLNAFGNGGDMTSDSTHLQDGLPCLVANYCSFLKLLPYIGNYSADLTRSKILPTSIWIAQQNVPGADNASVGATEENRLLAVKCAVKAVQAPFTISTVQ